MWRRVGGGIPVILMLLSLLAVLAVCVLAGWHASRQHERDTRSRDNRGKP